MAGAGRHGTLAAALILVASLLALGGVCEVVVRVFHLEEPRFIQRDPVYGVSHIPGQSGYWTKAPEPVYIEINSQGFRGPERPFEKPAGTYRVVIIGDSYVEAFAVPFEGTLSSLLERRLRARGYPVDAVALGVSDFGTAQELILLEREGLRYQPDLVVLAFTHNDLANNHPLIHSNTDRPYFRLGPDERLERLPFRMESRSRGPLRDFLRRNLRIYTFFPKRVREAVRQVRKNTAKDGPKRFQDHFELYPTAQEPLGREAWELTFALLREFRRTARAAGTEFVLLAVPYKAQVDRRYWEELVAEYPEVRKSDPDFEAQEPERLMEDFCRRENMRCLNLLPVFKKETAKGQELFGYEDLHWSTEGNRVAAEALQAAVEPIIRSHLRKPTHPDQENPP
jgi:lysophospholipase L1-like esterase